MYVHILYLISLSSSVNTLYGLHVCLYQLMMCMSTKLVLFRNEMFLARNTSYIILFSER